MGNLWVLAATIMMACASGDALPTKAPRPAHASTTVHTITVPTYSCYDSQVCSQIAPLKKDIRCSEREFVVGWWRWSSGARQCALLVKDLNVSHVVDLGATCAEEEKSSVQATCLGGEMLRVRIDQGDRHFTVTCRGLAQLDCSRSVDFHAPDPEVDKLLAELAKRTMNKKWPMIIELAEPAHRASQLGELKMTEAHYVGELLGLNYVGNSINPGDGITTEALDKIKRLHFTDAVVSGSLIEVVGFVELEDASMMQMSLMLRKHQGRYWLTGAVG